MTRISRKDIEKVFTLFLEKMDMDGLEDIEIKNDSYWIILSDEWHNLNTVPEPAVGSLAEDIELLKSAIYKNKVISYSDFDRLAAILREISEMQGPTSNENF